MEATQVRTEPRGMDDMTGWREVSCTDRDEVFTARGLLVPASSLTDPDGLYGRPVIFTEWWDAEEPALRDYRFGDGRPCTHYVPDGVDDAFRVSEL